MQESNEKAKAAGGTSYLSSPGAFALAFGCCVGWGAFVMPGSTFLPIGGPAGAAAGLILGAAAMLILAVNYHYLMGHYPDGGGTYTYTKKCFGYDHGFLCAWFLILTYIAIIWANATALPLIARTVLGSTFQFGFEYEIAGFHIYLGEIMLAEISLLIAALICLRRRLAVRTQILMAGILLVFVVICFAAAFAKSGGTAAYEPPYPSGRSHFGGIFTMFSLAPWAYVGFESISHSAGEAAFSLKKSFRIMACAIAAACAAYVFLILISVSFLPEGCSSWETYIDQLGTYQGIFSQPAFFAAKSALGRAGIVFLSLAALGAIFTGLIGNYIALSRLLATLSDDGMLPAWMGERKHMVPAKAVLTILCVSLILPFFGRTAISWIVDVTTIGATIAYAFASASALRTARIEGKKGFLFMGGIGVAVSVLFALEFLIPNLIAVKTLSTESYLILAAWGILGFACFLFVLKRDKEHRMGRSIVAWVVLLALIIFTSSVWRRQSMSASFDQASVSIHAYVDEGAAADRTHEAAGETEASNAAIDHELLAAERQLNTSSFIQTALVVVSLFILLVIYTIIQRREKQTEVEKVLAEERSLAKSSFLSNMSHEIRTPLNAIIGLDNIALKDEGLTERTRDHLEKIGASAKHLLGLINDILDMSRIESGRMVLKSEEFSIGEILKQVNIMIGGQCADKGLVYECRTDENLSDYYVGDEMKLKQILINILGNSVKFTDPPGEVILSVMETARSGSAATLHFSMKDTGAGMDKDYIPRIFEAFSQEDASATNRYGGSGLGMAITKNFVEMMGGEIRVESEKGVGTTFFVTVTLGTSERRLDAAEELEETACAREKISQLISGRRVLMAEDVEQNAEILADLLEMEDVLSEHAPDGEKAVQMFAEHPEGYYDAILMDVRMPVMDGLSAARAIREMARPDARTIPIIAMTANVFDEDVERSLAAGMDAHLFKPVEPERLYETLASFMERKEEALPEAHP